MALPKNIKTLIAAILITLLSSNVCALFFRALNLVISVFTIHYWLIWLLPISGLAIWKASRINIFSNAEKLYSPSLAPFIFFSSLLSHITGASVGRETVSIQIGGSIANSVLQYFRIDNQFQKTLFNLGVATGFSTMFSNPIVGAAYLFERHKERSPITLLFVLTLSYLGIIAADALIGLHTFKPLIIDANFQEIIKTSIILFIPSLILILTYTQIDLFLKKKIQYNPINVILGSTSLLVFGYLLDNNYYNTLSLPLLHDAFLYASNPSDFLLKLIFTLISMHSGFRGGEFVPLMVAGVTFSSFASTFISSASLNVFSSLGLYSLVACRFRIPLTCSILIFQYSDWKWATCSMVFYMTLYHSFKFVNENLLKSIET